MSVFLTPVQWASLHGRYTPEHPGIGLLKRSWGTDAQTRDECLAAWPSAVRDRLLLSARAGRTILAAKARIEKRRRREKAQRRYRKLCEV